MAIKIDFDSNNMPIEPVLVLAAQNGDNIGTLTGIEKLKIDDNMKSPAQISFTIHKMTNGKEYKYWDQIRNFRLLYVPIWKKHFVMTVTVNETTELTKEIVATSLQETELGQVLLHNVEINTENDIDRDDYEITVLYAPGNPKASLLNRILSAKAPNYKIIHVDESLQKMQRTFTFDGKSIYDAFQEIEEELNCMFVYGEEDTSNDGLIQRTISVYDLESTCKDCGYRGEFLDQCSKCGGTNFTSGYGEDTTIFVNKENLAEDISVSSDTGSVKNCFYIEAGDDLMTSTVININPSGSQYIWYFTDEMKEDMSDELREKLESYDKKYSFYQSEYIAELNDDILQKYNDLIVKYREFDMNLTTIQPPIRGFSSLMKAYYDAIDFYGYLYSSLMPSVKIDKVTAKDQAALLTSESLSPISVQNIKYISLATANSTIINYTKVLIDTARYKPKVKNSSIDGTTWTGVITVESYYDDEESCDTELITVTFDGDYENFVKQEIDKSLAKNKEENEGIVGLFKKELDDFKLELKKYSYSNLQILQESCQACLDVMIDQGVSNEDTWVDGGDVYNKLYSPMLQKKEAIEKEMILRESEISIINGTLDEYGDVEKKGIKNYIEDLRKNILNDLDFQKYIGDSWGELNLFRREDTWTNSNYISDGLTNQEIFDNANKFMESATKDIKKSSELKNTISSNLKNLLIMPEFSSIVKYFSTGNWIRFAVDDNVYKLRLLNYSLDYSSISTISVEFSDATKKWGIINDIEKVISQSKQMATSYNSVKYQAEKSIKTKETVDDWVEKGIDATTTQILSGDNQEIVWGKNGFLCRRWNPMLNAYENSQIKIINSSLVYTNDNWLTSGAAIGSFEFYNPKTKQMETGYGVIAKQLIGNIILGENIGIYNKNGTMEFDENGLSISNGTNIFNVNPNKKSLLSIKKGNEDVFVVSDSGDLSYTGDVNARKLFLEDQMKVTNDKNTLVISKNNNSVFSLKSNSQEKLFFDEKNLLNFEGKVTTSDLTLGKDVIIPMVNIENSNMLLTKDSTLGESHSFNNETGFSISSSGLLKTNKSSFYNSELLNFDKENNLYTGVSTESNSAIFAGATSQDGANAKFKISSNGVVTSLKTLDAWENESNVVTSDNNSMIKMKYEDDYLEFYLGTELMAKIKKGFVAETE